MLSYIYGSIPAILTGDLYKSSLNSSKQGCNSVTNAVIAMFSQFFCNLLYKMMYSPEQLSGRDRFFGHFFLHVLHFCRLKNMEIIRQLTTHKFLNPFDASLPLSRKSPQLFDLKKSLLPSAGGSLLQDDRRPYCHLG